MELIKNGILIQQLNNPTQFVTKFPYNGINAYFQDVLHKIKDERCAELYERSVWKKCDDGLFELLQFMTNMDFAKEYMLECKKHDIPIRALFIESTYTDEIWDGELPQSKFLGYEYSPIPWDNQVVTDIEWYAPLQHFIPKLNADGLFDSAKDVMRFKMEYDAATDKDGIGDGVEAYICRVSELIL